MDFFTDHYVQWIIGLTCALIPAIVGLIISKAKNIPDIKIPIWLICFIVAAIFIHVGVKYYPTKTKDIANKSFGVERIVIDGKFFVNCNFNGTELVFLGELPFSMAKNTFYDCRLAFEGNALLTTKAFTALYSEPGFRQMIDATFENIKNSGIEKEREYQTKIN